MLTCWKVRQNGLRRWHRQFHRGSPALFPRRNEFWLQPWSSRWPWSRGTHSAWRRKLQGKGKGNVRRTIASKYVDESKLFQQRTTAWLRREPTNLAEFTGRPLSDWKSAILRCKHHRNVHWIALPKIGQAKLLPRKWWKKFKGNNLIWMYCSWSIVNVREVSMWSLMPRGRPPWGQLRTSRERTCTQHHQRWLN